MTTLAEAIAILEVALDDGGDGESVAVPTDAVRVLLSSASRYRVRTSEEPAFDVVGSGISYDSGASVYVVTGLDGSEVAMVPAIRLVSVVRADLVEGLPTD